MMMLWKIAKFHKQNETTAPVDGEAPAVSNKRKRDFKAERIAKRQRKEEKEAPKRAIAAIREAEEAIVKEKKAAEKAEAKRKFEEELAASREQKEEEKARRFAENLRQQAEDKQKRLEEKKEAAEVKKRAAEKNRKDLERIQALEKQVRDLKRGHGNGKGKGKNKAAKKVEEKKGPKTSEFFGVGLKAQVVGMEKGKGKKEELAGEVAGLEQGTKKNRGGKVLKSKRSWKDLRSGDVAPMGLEEKIAAARLSVAQAADGLDEDVPMEDALEVGAAEEQVESEDDASEKAATESEPVSYPSIEHLIEDNSAVESEAPAETEDEEVGSKISEESSIEVEEKKVDDEIPEVDSEDQEEDVAAETSPAVQEEETPEEDASKEKTAPVADTEMEVDEPKRETDVNASAKKRSRKRVRNNNRLETEGTPIKPVTPASSKSQKVKTPATTPLATKDQNVKTPTKSPAQSKAPAAKKGKAPVKAATKAQTVAKASEESVDANAPKAKRVRVPKARAAVLAATTALDSPARNTRRSAKANHS